MNKMAKGAIATAAGVVLLIGGGGTLAVWNVETDSQAGTIESGDLNMTLLEGGAWSVNDTGALSAADIGSVHIVPGDVLTYTQPMSIVLDGNDLLANVSVVIPEDLSTTFDEGTYDVSDITLMEGTQQVSNPLDSSKNVIASVSFTFDPIETSGREGVNDTYSFSDVAFKLEQVLSTP